MKKFSYLKTTAHSEIVFLYELTKQKIREIVDALVKRNQISTWPMWKSDFRMGHVEIWFLSTSATMISRIFLKGMEIYQWPTLILTHTGISIFSLNHVIARPTKIMQNTSKIRKFVISKSFFSVKNQQNLSDFLSWKILDKEINFYKWNFWNFWFLKYFAF